MYDGIHYHAYILYTIVCIQGNKEALVILQSANNESRSDDNIILGRHSDIADCWGSKNMYSTLYAQDIA